MADSDDDLGGGAVGVRGTPVDPAPGAPHPAPRPSPHPASLAAQRLRTVAAQHGRLDALLAERARSQFLSEVGRRLGLSLHPGRIARVVLELTVGALADAAAVVWCEPGGHGTVEWVAAARGGAERAGQALAAGLPGSVLDALYGLGSDLHPVAPDELAATPWSGVTGPAPRPGHPAARAAVVTLPGSCVPSAALVLVWRPGGGGAPAPDAPLIGEFAQRAGVALCAAALYAHQRHVTDVLVGSLAQPELPRVPGVHFGAAYRPADAGLLIGGDLYDVLPPSGDATTFLLGDVCGKGVDAAVRTAALRQSVLALRRVVPEPLHLLELLNATMLEAVPPDQAPRFVTLVLGTATPRPDGGVALELAAGGHPPPLVVRRGGRVERVDVGGMLVGAVARARFARHLLHLAPGESCVLYSDGVTEAHGGPVGSRPFGEERLADVLAGCDVLPASGIAEHVVLHTARWLGAAAHDDIAVLVVQAPPVGRRDGEPGVPDRPDEEVP